MNRRVLIVIAAGALLVAACSGSGDEGLDASRSDARATTSSVDPVATTEATTSPTEAPTTVTTAAEPTPTSTATDDGDADDDDDGGTESGVVESTTTTSSTTTTTTTLPPLEPLDISGEGVDVVPLSEPFARTALAVLTFEGEGEVSADLLDDSAERVDGLVSAAGPYSGTVVVNPRGDESFSYIQVESSGAWTIDFRDVSEAELLDGVAGATHDGVGDSALRVSNDAPLILAFTCSECAGEVTVRSWIAGERETIIDAEGAFDGRQLLPAGDHLLAITTASQAGSPAWTLRLEE